MAQQNSSGSWGTVQATEERDTAVVIDALQKLRETGTGYTKAISFLNNLAPANTDYLARKTAVLAKDGSDISASMSDLLAAQNPAEPTSTLPNFPEGGWGATAGYATNNLDTSLVLDALFYVPIPKGLLIINKTIAAGATQDFFFDYPADGSDLQIQVTTISGSITFRLYPDVTGASYSWPPVTSPTFLGLSGATVEPGSRRVQITGNAATTYSLQITLTSSGYNSSALIPPLTYLSQSQNSDGGWGLAKGADSNIFLSAQVLNTLEQYTASYDFGGSITKGIAWLKGRQNPDGGFGAEGSTVYETATACVAMAFESYSSPQAQSALSYLTTSQEANGSWNDSAHDTAMALMALWTSLGAVDTDGDGAADNTDNCPDLANADQANHDNDKWGDACDDDDDNDGLADTFEKNLSGTDPLLADTDADGITDNLEDMDFDGLSNLNEQTGGTHPRQPDVALGSGLNLFGYPVEAPAGYSAFDLLLDLGGEPWVEQVMRFNPVSGAFDTARFENGQPAGTDFAIRNGEGYMVYMKKASSVSFLGKTPTPVIDLSPGFNLVSIPAMRPGFSSYDLLWTLGSSEQAASVQGFNRNTGAFETTAYFNEEPAGVEFPIVGGEGFIVNMKTAGSLGPLLVAPEVTITSPVNGATVPSTPITVTGTISDSTAVVAVNGTRATVGSGNFTAPGVPLSEGANTITATATGINNLTSSHSITVTLEAADYVLPKGGTASGNRSFQFDPAIAGRIAFYSEKRMGIPPFITYTTTAFAISGGNAEVSFSIAASASATAGTYTFQVEYGLSDSASQPLGPLTNNVFSFKVKVLP